MDIRKVKKLIELLEESSIAEIEIKEGEEAVRISRTSQVKETVSEAGAPPTHTTTATPPDTAANRSVKPDNETATHSGTAVKSPMVGTFYCSSAPNEPPFVEEGKPVNQGDTVCIIEAMKVMNHIEAPVSGTVTRILVGNGEPVEFDQTLMIIQ